MASTLSKFSRAKYRLQQAYISGSTQYPRVASDYIEDIDFYEHPHPPLSPFDEYSTPMLKKEYPFIKEVLPLELMNEGISTPATLFRNLEVCDRFFDNDLHPRENKSVELNNKIEAFYEHIEMLVSQFDKDGIINNKNGKAKISNLTKDGSASIYKMQRTPFKIVLAPSPERAKKAKEEKKKKVKDDKKNYPEEMEKKRITVSSMNDAHKLFRKKRIFMNRQSEKIKNEQTMKKLFGSIAGRK